jgi:hypothetical protein
MLGYIVLMKKQPFVALKYGLRLAPFQAIRICRLLADA